MCSAAAIVDETRHLIEVIGGPCDVAVGRDRWFEVVARAVGLTPSRVAGLFYKKVRRPHADEYLALKAKAQEIHARNAQTRATLAAIRAARGDGGIGLAVPDLGHAG